VEPAANSKRQIKVSNNKREYITKNRRERRKAREEKGEREKGET